MVLITNTGIQKGVLELMVTDEGHGGTEMRWFSRIQ
jgi:hypothetical protein